MANKLIRFNKKNPCAVCGSGTKGCSHDTIANTYLCRGFDTADTANFKLLSTTADGVWGTYKAVSDCQENNAEFFKKQRELKAQRELEKARRLSKLLSVEERNVKISNLLNQLTLSEKHRNELISRGLSEKNIDRQGYRSISKGSYFSNALGIPGFIGNNKSAKYVGASGIILPIRNVEAKLIGFQIKADDASQGKYKWTVSSVSAHLNTGELPLQVIQGYSGVGLCEGILKPAIAATRHKINLIGAAGGSFPKQQLSEALAKLNPLRTETVIFYADAGSLSNENVYRQIIKTGELVESLGYKFAIADWNQLLDKTAKDIDEIDNLEGVRYLSLVDITEIHNNPAIYVKPVKADPVFDSELPKFLEQILKASKAVNVKTRDLEVTNGESEWEYLLPGSDCEVGGAYEFDQPANQVYEKLLRDGHKTILDLSQTGAGKSFHASRVEPERCFKYGEDEQDKEKQRKLFYCSTSSRNPNIEKLESDFAELPARNNGYRIDENKKTPLGNPYRYHAQEGDAKATVGNCHWAPMFNTVRESKSNLDICGLCPHKQDCHREEGKGYGFKFQVRQSLKANKIRCNPQGLSPEFVSGKAVAIVDEYTQAMAFGEEIKISYSDVDDVILFLATCRSYEAFQLTSLLVELKDVIRAVQPKTVRFGYGTAEILEKLNLDMSLETIKAYLPKVLEQIEEYNLSLLKEETKNKKGLKGLAKNWLEPFVNLALGLDNFGSMRLHRNELTIQIRNKRVLEVFNSFHGVIYQDATGSRIDLAIKLGINPEDITVIRKKVDSPDNVTVHQIQGFGKAGKDRSKDCQKRIEATKEVLVKQWNSEIGFIDWKPFCTGNDLVHFSDARGSNLFQTKKAIASFGIPYPQISGLLLQYETYTGKRSNQDDPEFIAYYNDAVASEIIQEIGRLRANRRKDEELHFYLCGDLDLTFLTNMGYKVEQSHAMNLTLEAGDLQSKARYSLLEATKRLLKRGYDLSEINTTSWAREVECSRQNIHKIASKLGGLEQFKKILGLLLYDTRQDYTDAFGAIDDEIRWQANSYLPLLFACDFDEVGTELVNMQETYSPEQFAAILLNTGVETAATILEHLLLTMPHYYRSRIIKLVRSKE